jgi:TonB-dependent receptor
MKLILPKANKLRHLLVAVAFLSFGKLHAQQISGVVTGPDKSALPGATISIPGSGIVSSSDLNGAFQLSNNKTGKLSLSIKYVGYKEKKIELDVTEGKNELGELEMESRGGVLGEVIISGATAGSQAKALSMKRSSLGIVDVLAADAIGKLPDRNAAEAVQRIQGVAVARYHGESDQATVRGTPFAWTSTLFNGNRLPSSNVMGNRSSVLDAVPSEMIQYVQVAKAITPDMEGDAIGGSINFITRTAPLKRMLNVSGAGGYNSFSQNGTYNGSIVYGDRFFKNKLGVMLAGAIWDRNWGTDEEVIAYNTGLATADLQKSINSVLLKRYMGKRQTKGANLGLEYKFNDQNRIFFRGLMDKFNDIRPVYESYVDYNNSRYQYNYRYSHYQTVLNGAELGGEHQLSSKVKLDWMASDYVSRYFLETPGTNPNNGLPIATFRQKINGGFNNLSGNGKRYWGFDAPDGIGGDPLSFDPGIKNSAEIMDPAKLTLQQLVIAQLDTKEEDKTFQANLKVAAGKKINVKFGGKYRHKYREGVYGSNIVYLPGAALGVPNSSALLTLSQLNHSDFPKSSGFFSGLNGNYDQFIVSPLSKDQLFDLYDSSSLRKNGFVDVTSKSNVTNFYNGTEEVIAGYAMAEIDATAKLKIIGGVRNEYTSIELKGSKAEVSAKETAITAVKTSNSYHALLPMLHLKYSINEKANVRAAYTRTFIRANFADMTPGESINTTTNPISLTKGNPNLKPTFSNNVDVMGEYFFDNIGLLSGGVFYKGITDVIFNNASFYSEGGKDYRLTQSQNLDKASLFGFEAGINKRFTFLNGFWSGFGVEFNYTRINSSVEVPRLGSKTGQMDKTSLPNQSKALFNAILFYERNGVMVRLAGNFRGRSVEAINQQLGPEFYTWMDDYFTIDFSASVKVSKQFRVFAEMNNLNNAPLKMYMGDERRLSSVEWYGLRGQAGVRWDIIK